MKAEDMDVVGSLFGLRFVTGGGPEGLVELFLEDDGNYHFKTTFNHVWLGDLIRVARRAKAEFPRGKKP